MINIRQSKAQAAFWDNKEITVASPTVIVTAS